MKPALVVLAAGASRRLGRCKALVELGGRPALLRLLEAAAVLDSHPPLVVVGADARPIRERLPSGIECLENPDWGRGRTGSLARAVEARPGLDLAVAPVDCPLVPGAVFEALLAAWQAAGSPALGWLSPRHPDARGSPRHGHPLFLGAGLAREVPRLPPDRSLRELRGSARPVIGLTVDSARVLDHLDDPSDLLRLRGILEEAATGALQGPSGGPPEAPAHLRKCPPEPG